MSFATLLAIGSGGFIGAILRAYINALVSERFPHTTLGISYGTLAVNLLGSFIMGLLFAYFLHNNTLAMPLKSFITTGLLGALTTYSTFAIESFLLLHNHYYLLAFSNMGSNLLGTILMAGLGFYIIEAIFR